MSETMIEEIDNWETMHEITLMVQKMDHFANSGRIIYAFRHGNNILNELSKLPDNQEIAKSLHKSLYSLKRGEMIEASNSIKSTMDILKQRRRQSIERIKDYVSSTRENVSS